MANRVPLIANTSANQIQELAVLDNLDLSQSGIVNAVSIGATNISATGIVTAGSFSGPLTGDVTGNASGLASGATGADLTLTGNLTVNGTQTILNTTALEVEDINIGIASANPKLSNAALDGAGITIYGSAGDKTLTWDNGNSRLAFSTDVYAPRYYGDGSNLQGVVSGVTIQEEGSSLSTKATTLNFIGDNVTAAGNGATKTITIGGSSSPTITWTLTANGSSDYVFSGDGFPTNQNDPTLYLIRGQTYKFVNNTGGHPFRIQSTTAASGGGTQYNSGVTNQDAGNGVTLTFVVPMDAPDTLYYQCTSHTAMFGPINILNQASGLETKEGGTSKGTSQVSLNFTGATVTSAGTETTVAIASAGLTTEASVVSGAVVTLDLSNAQDHKVTATGSCTITCSGGAEGESHTVRIINNGSATIGFSTYFLFPSGSTPSLPSADGSINLISFTVNRVGVAGTQLLTGASVNFS